MSRPWSISKEIEGTCRDRFAMWLRERGGVVVYENHVLDSSHLGERTFMPARYEATDDQMHEAPDEWRPHGGLPSLRQQRVDHVKLEEFEGDIERAITACFAFSEG